MYCIGFDIGGTKCAVSLGKWLNKKIEILKRQETPTKRCPYETLGNLASYIYEWKAEFLVKTAGVSCCGPLDSEKGIIISTPNLPNKWHGFEIVSYIQSQFGLKAKLENDANFHFGKFSKLHICSFSSERKRYKGYWFHRKNGWTIKRNL